MEWEIIQSRLMHLIEGGRRNELRGALLMLNVVDIAQFMAELDGQGMLMVFRLLPKDISAEVFAYMEAEQQEQLVEHQEEHQVEHLEQVVQQQRIRLEVN